jgi:hypothetical protein
MRTALALLVAALLLSSCGAAAPRDSAKDFKGAERDVATAVEDVEDAARKADAGALCTKLLSPSLLTMLETQGTNCKTAVREAFKDADSLDLTVKDVTINGEKATAKVTSGTGSDEKSDTLELEKSGATWKISSLRA